MLKYVLGVVLTVNCAASVATTLQSTGTISKLSNFEAHGGPIVQLNDMSKTSGSCTRNDFFILETTHKFYDQNYSLLLAAKMAGKEVTVTVDNGDCVENMPRLKHLYIE